MRTRVLILLFGAMPLLTSAQPSGMDGAWQYVGSTPDAVTGEPEAFYLSVRVAGNKVCGSFMSAYRGGVRVDEGNFEGRVSGSESTVAFHGGFAANQGTGIARIAQEITPGRDTLTWQVVRPLGVENYVIARAVLRRGGKVLKVPMDCK